MKRRDYIPAKDSNFDSFQGNFITQVTANAVPWNIVAAALAALLPLQTAWAATWAIAKVKVNRSLANIAAKNVARENYQSALRLFIQSSIYHNAAVNDADVELCGLQPYDRTRTPVPVPLQLPVVNLQHGAGNVFVVRYFRLEDETGAIRRGKPDGVAKIEFVYNLDVQPASPEACTGRSFSSRSPIRVTVPAAMRGKNVWFYARWVNTHDVAGPWTDLDFFVL